MCASWRTPLAASNFNYLLGSYELELGLPGPEAHLRRVEFTMEPGRWLKSRVKLGRHLLGKAVNRS